MADKFKWADRYQKEGFKVFDAQSVSTLGRIQVKYTKDFRDFFMSVEAAYKGTKLTAEQQRINEVLHSIDEVGMLIAKLLTTQNVIVGEEELERLFVLTNELDDEFRFFSDPANFSAALQGRIQEAEKKSGIKATDIASANKLMKGRLENVARAKPSFGQKMEPYTPVLKPLGEGMKDIAYKMLGPFEEMARLGGKAVGGISGMARARKERKLNLERQAFHQATILSGEADPGELETYRDIQSVGRAPVRKDIHRESRRTGDEGLRASASSTLGPYSTASERKRGKQQEVSMQQALFTFFMKDAYRARWTKELLETIQLGAAGGLGKKAGGLGEKVVGGLGSRIMDALGLNFLGGKLKALGLVIGNAALGLAKFAGGLAAVGAAGFAGWKAGRLLGENIKWGGESLDVHTEKFISKNLMGVNQETAEQSKGTRAPVDAFGKAINYDPVTELRKRYMLEDKSLTSQEAQAKAVAQVEKTARIRAEKAGGMPAGQATGGFNPATPEVPIVTPPEELPGIKSLGDTFKSSMAEMIAGIKKMNDRSLINNSGMDTRDIGDPLTGDVSKGLIGP